MTAPSRAPYTPITSALTPCALDKTSWLNEPWGGMSRNDSEHPVSKAARNIDRTIGDVFLNAFIAFVLRVFSRMIMVQKDRLTPNWYWILLEYVAVSTPPGTCGSRPLYPVSVKGFDTCA